jgi:hypothetical protein
MMYLAVAINEPDNSLIAAIINIFTKSKAHHVEPVFSDGTAFNARPGGVELIKRDYDYYNWLLVPCPFMSEEDEKVARNKADSIMTAHPGYDYLGAIAGIFGSSREDPSKWYCGELCAVIFGDKVQELNTRSWDTPEFVWKTISDYVRDHYVTVLPDRYH